ncbi:Protein O-mannosyl-transferase TMTC3, partial [Geodia barretti]
MAVVRMRVETVAAICALVGSLVFLNSLGLQLCFDDTAAVKDNADLRPNVSWFNLLRNDFWGTEISHRDSHKSYRPLTVATFRLNYMLHELEPLGYHLVNVLLHSAVVYLYVLLCGVVFSEVWPALIAGLLFAVHPIHTEAVSGVVGRADVLSCLFFIGSILTYKKSLSTKNSALFMMCTLLLAVCSALSKEIGITVVAMCPIYEVLIHRKMNLRNILRIILGMRRRNKPSIEAENRWLKSLLFRTAVIGSFALTFLYLRLKLNKTPPIFSVSNNPAMKFPTPFRQLHWSYLCVYNVWLLLSPSQLCAEYAMGTIPPVASLSDPRNLLTLATFAGLLSLSCYSASYSHSHHRKIMFGLCLTVLPFLPASNLFFPVGFVIAERVLYIPSMGFCLLVSYGFHLLVSNSKRFSPFFKSVIVFLLLVHGIKTVVRTR